MNKQFINAKNEQVIPLFEKKPLKDVCEVIIETYLKIDLEEYQEGGRVIFKRNMIQHMISLFFNEKKISKIK